ncbi:MAG: ABC transporter ATP-binding protein [Clostridiales bacterium]|nr:ABC transporter ATP-binding protein [Clostridiales bacterium]
MEQILEMVNIVKTFPGVVANNKVSFEVRKREIHALVGENGAGKTTLMNILYGLYKPDGGDIIIAGEKTSIDSPIVAIEKGIGLVAQHFMLIEPLTVAENIILGLETRKNKIFTDMRKANQKVKELSELYGLEVDPTARIMDISVGVQQRVEILKILYREAQILILDEPTAVLTPQETKELYKVLFSLKEMGKSVVFITHKLNEVMDISDRVTVLRGGKAIGTVNTSETDATQLASMMVGREVLMRVKKEGKKLGEAVLELRKVSAVDSRKLPALKNVSLEIRAGEILGIAGVQGNGQTELVEVLTGLRKATSGEVMLKGDSIINKNSRSIRELRVAHIPEDRNKRGLILDYDVADNLILGPHYKPPFTYRGKRNLQNVWQNARNLIAEFDIRTPSYDTKAETLSGGNQQKIVVARELGGDISLLVVSQPTRGLDIGTIEFIHKRILELRDKGVAILLVSAELTEIMSLSDRIAVMYDGNIVGILQDEEAKEEQIGMMMTGISKVDALRGEESD